MSAITAAGSSAYNVLASLLDGTTSANATAPVNKSPAADSIAPSSNNPTDVVDLSDHAKAVLARAKYEKAVADKFQAELDALKSDGSNASADGSNSSSGNGKTSSDNESNSFQDIVNSSANAPRSRTFVNGIEVSAIVTESYDFEASATLETNGFSESVSVERKGVAVADLDTHGKPIYGGFVAI